jgi:dihydrofolate reductase
MGKITAVCNVTLDGVMQAPGRPDEDTRNGFEYGGWATPYSQDAMGRVLGSRAGTDGGMLLGRQTYEDFADFWPNQPANPYTDALNKQQKYVVSTTLTAPNWVNSQVIAPTDIPALKAEQSLVILGSGHLIRSIPDLIDEYILLIHPLILGSGQKLFGNTHQNLQLTDSVTTTTAVIIATYHPANGQADQREARRV